jgi:hypothetical protein
MHFHLPKPLHGWRAFAGEVGIIVIGVLIALGAEQIVESWHWHDKVQIAKKSIDFEVNVQLDYSEEVMSFKPCAGPFVDALEAAILRHDAATIGKLHDTRPPFEARPWRSTAWQSAMSTEVADHLDPDELAEYALMFTSFDDLRGNLDAIVNDFAEATTGRLGGPADAASIQLQLSAAERLRTHLALQSAIAGTMVNLERGRAELNWMPIRRRRWWGWRRPKQDEAALCLRTVTAPGKIAPAQSPGNG